MWQKHARQDSNGLPESREKPPISDMGGPTGGAISFHAAGGIALETNPATTLHLAELVRNAGPDVHADAFSQARFLLDCGLLAAAAATARAAVESRIRELLKLDGKASRMELRMLLGMLSRQGLIDRIERDRLGNYCKQLGAVIHGRPSDVDSLRSCIESVAMIYEGLSGDRISSQDDENDE